MKFSLNYQLTLSSFFCLVPSSLFPAPSVFYLLPCTVFLDSLHNLVDDVDQWFEDVHTEMRSGGREGGRGGGGGGRMGGGMGSSGSIDATSVELLSALNTALEDHFVLPYVHNVHTYTHMHTRTHVHTRTHACIALCQPDQYTQYCSSVYGWNAHVLM